MVFVTAQLECLEPSGLCQQPLTRLLVLPVRGYTVLECGLHTPYETIEFYRN